MTHSESFCLRLLVAVFTLVSAAFTNICFTQPVLPVLQQEFSADRVVVSLIVSAVILDQITRWGFLNLIFHPDDRMLDHQEYS
jgi:hypothetical protein